MSLNTSRNGMLFYLHGKFVVLIDNYVFGKHIKFLNAKKPLYNCIVYKPLPPSRFEIDAGASRTAGNVMG